MTSETGTAVAHEMQDSVRRALAALKQLHKLEDGIASALENGLTVDPETYGSNVVKEAAKLAAALARLQGAREIAGQPHGHIDAVAAAYHEK